MRWGEFFTGMMKNAREGMHFYQEYWLETLILFIAIFAIILVVLFIHTEIRYKREHGKWFNVKRLWK